VKKYGRAREAAGGNVTRRMRFACWIINGIDVHSEYVICFAFSTATIVTRTLLNIMLQVHCRSCFTRAKQTFATAAGTQFLILHSSRNLVGRFITRQIGFNAAGS
jgi:hypothetical protein